MLRSYRPEADLEALLRIQALAFHTTRDSVRIWLERAGAENVRIVERDGSLLAGLVDIPMGQFWGGERVRMHGVAGVAVAPEARGAGLARAMMKAYLEELRAAEVPLATLHASTRALYRSVGFELAGVSFRYDLPSEALVGTRGPALRLLEPAEIRERYASFARRRDGWLDRGPYIWERVLRDAEVFGNEDAHVVVAQEPLDGRPGLVVRDWAFAGADGARGILAHLAGYGTIARTCRLIGGPAHPLVDELAEQRAAVALREIWMLRVVHLEHALRTRGYPAGVRADLTLHVEDPLFPENRGPWSLSVEDGRAAVARAARADTRLDVRVLASLYTGYRSPWELRALGHLEADDRACALLATVFAGSPSLPDFF